MNSLYGKTIQKDIKTNSFLWNEATFLKNYDEDLFKSCDKINDNQWYVEMLIAETEINDNEKENKFTDLLPNHLGTFILGHSKRIMNNFLFEIGGFKQQKLFYTDCDSLYISSDNYEILNSKGLVGNEMGQGKNDYGNGGIIYGLFLAPKVKYCITLNDDFILEEHKTFKGYTKQTTPVDDYLKLEAGKTIQNITNSPWKKSFEYGIIIPSETLTKNYNTNSNFLKRKHPDENGIMLPYNTKETGRVYKDIKTKYDLTDNDMMANLFDVEYSLIDIL